MRRTIPCNELTEQFLVVEVKPGGVLIERTVFSKVIWRKPSGESDASH
jgi:hypothetical protein